jgi:peroxiredoxin
MPALQALHEDFHDQGLEILSVNQGEAPQAVQQFVHERGYTLHVLVDPDRRIGGQYGVYSIPTLVVIDKQGRIQRIHIGTEDMKELRPLLERLTKE